MQEYGYASLSPADEEKHRNEHRRFSQQVVALRAGLRDGCLVTREELLSFLNNWLINHILDTDQHLGAFLNSHGHPTSGSKAR